VLLDASNSMKYSSHQVSKMDYARFIAASLFYLMTHTQHDAAGLIVFDDELRDYIRPSTHHGQFFRLLSCLERAEPRARTDFAKPIQHFHDFLRRRGIVVMISDFYELPGRIVRSLEPLQFRGNEVLLFHVLDPKEMRPEFHEPTALVDLETGDTIEVSPEYAENDYRQKIDSHVETLRDLAHGSGMDYYPLITDRPLDGALREYLRVRQGRF
ncbi:MAG TPA: VWA domain-containing protein, partial [Terriglobia bacterium]|nr:VWA domain-containing protein [Terriglobia bacterium]